MQHRVRGLRPASPVRHAPIKVRAFLASRPLESAEQPPHLSLAPTLMSVEQPAPAGIDDVTFRG
jgi:hypothetical protein